MATIPNPWIPQSEADNSHVPDTAAALADLGRSAAAVPTPEPSTAMEVPTEAPAALTSPIDAGATDWDINATDCVNEIFWFVRNKLKDEPPRFVLDEGALMDAIDEPPLFLRQRAAE